MRSRSIAEQQLIRQAISDRAARVLQEVDSVAETQDATEAIRREYDPQWVERRAGYWLETYFDDDMVVVVDASDRVEYERARSAAGPATIDGLWSSRPFSIFCAGVSAPQPARFPSSARQMRCKPAASPP